MTCKDCVYWNKSCFPYTEGNIRLCDYTKQLNKTFFKEKQTSLEKWIAYMDKACEQFVYHGLSVSYKPKYKCMNCKNRFNEPVYVGKVFSGCPYCRSTNFKYINKYIERKNMDKIEIDVRINDEKRKLSDISDETIANIKKSEQFKPIKHGDYGYYIHNVSVNRRLFVEKNGKIVVYCDDGVILCEDVNSAKCKYTYTIKGNIFEDLENEKTKS